MGKLTEAFAMSRRQRQGMTLVMFLLVVSLVWLWFSERHTEPVTEAEIVEMRQFSRTTDSLLVAQAIADSIKQAELIEKQHKRALKRQVNQQSKHASEKQSKTKAKQPAKSAPFYDPMVPVSVIKE